MTLCFQAGEKHPGTVSAWCWTGFRHRRRPIKAARLEWRVEQTPVYSANNWAVPIPGYLANVRSDTREVLGIVGEKYQVAQNRDVFAFADELIGTNKAKCTYETAGSLFNGRRVFMLVNMPKGRIVGDEYCSYLCLSNAHDGTSSLQIFLTGIRVVCNNTLQAALHTAKRKISIRYLSGMEIRKEEALKAMGVASKYFHVEEKEVDDEMPSMQRAGKT
jgi:phage/plasmid-like protein (TIGR03299 family)